MGLSCSHCGLPVPPALEPEDKDSDQPVFCCPGCEAVYFALRGEGLEGYYDMREATGAQGAQPRPVQVADHWDSPDFLEKHTELLADGTRSMEIYLDGVHCAGCVWIVEKMPQMLPGTLEARLDLPRARLSVRWDPRGCALSQVVAWLGRFGYSAHPLRGERVKGRDEAERRLLVRVGVSWALAGNVMLLASAFYVGLDAKADPGLYRAALWVSLALTGGSILFGGRTFLTRAWASLRAAVADREGLVSLSMDVPITLGILVGWGYSAAVTLGLAEGEVWFDSIAVLIAALLTARWLQVRGRRKAGDAADRLLSLLPGRARRVDAQGEVHSVEVEDLQVGDIVEVRAGELVPADGVVVSGVSSVHRGVLTGESRPERVEPGESIHAGVTNLGSALRLEVQAAGSQTRVGQLLSWIEDRVRERAPVVQRADRIGGIFVLAVVVASVIVGALWTWLAEPSEAVSVVVALLVIACPCALGMATPLSLTVAVGQAARRGIFIKHDDVLERLSRVTHVVLDKTGTLTLGQMSVTALEGDKDVALEAARLEALSQHPIAEALVRWRQENAAAAPALDPEQVTELPGSGLRGEIQGQRYLVGRPAWVMAQVKEVAPRWQAAVERFAEQGHSPVVIAHNQQIKAVMGLGDPLRASSRRLVASLLERGVKPILLSGDHAEVVASTALSLGLEPQDAHGGVSPEKKRRFVEALAADPAHVVVMVGDGVNDAAALQAAHIGVAVQGGTHASLVAADIFTTRPGLDPVLELLDGSRRTMAVIQRSLTGSLLYNLLGVSLAGLGLVGPLVAAVAMPISSLSVVISSLVQRSFPQPQGEQGEEVEPTYTSEEETSPGAENARVALSA